MAGPSPRGLLSLMRMSRGIALVNGRDFVLPDDIKYVASDTLSHRIVPKPEFALEELNTTLIVSEYVSKIPVPK